MQAAGTSSKKKEEKISNVVPLREMFEAYCDLDTVAEMLDVDVDMLPFSLLKTWLQKAGVIDMSRVTVTDAFLCFFQFKTRAITYEEFLIYLEDLAETKNLDLNLVKHKLQTCGKPPEPRDSQ